MRLQSLLLLCLILATLLCSCRGSNSASGPSVSHTYNLESISPFPGMADWTMQGGGPTHSGYVPVTLDASRFSARWSIVLPKGNQDLCDNQQGFYDCVFIYQAVTDSADRRVLVMTNAVFQSANTDNNDFTLQGLDETDGSVVWSKGFQFADDPEDIGGTFFYSLPSVFAGKAYFSYYVSPTMSPAPPALAAFGAKSGDALFTVSPPIAVTTQAVVSNGVIYMGMPLSAYDADTGALLWTSSESGSDPSIGSGAAYLAQDAHSTTQPALTALSLNSGTSLFQVTGVKDPGIPTPPMLDGMGGAVVGRFGATYGSRPQVLATGYLDHYSLATHSEDWKVFAHFSHITQPAIAKGVVYACDGKAVTAYAVSDGTKLWSWIGDSSLQDDGAGTSNCSILATNNLLFVSSYTTTYALDMTSHAVVWTWGEGGQLSLSPSGILYISVDAPAPIHLVAINLH